MGMRCTCIRRAIPIVLSPEEKLTLQNLQRSRTAEVRQAERATIILLAAEGKEDIEIAAELGISRFKAGRWRKRYVKLG
jgi:hypothetical protein